jgi:predicted nucleotidyltransferase
MVHPHCRVGVRIQCDNDLRTGLSCARVYDHRSAGVEHLSLLGSWSRGTAVPALSDIDLIADFDARREYSLFDRVRLENRLADIRGTKVELVPHRR